MLKEKECDFVQAGEIIVELFEIFNKCNSLKKNPDMWEGEIMRAY